jgi:DNA-binding HxlR family transcriptional regulator
MAVAILAFVFVLTAVVSVITLHVLLRFMLWAAQISRTAGREALILAVLILSGGVGLLMVLGSPRPDLVVPPYLKVSALLLYVAGCATYLEIMSLVSRGYSLRILVDLLDHGGQLSIRSFKDLYGGGLGIRGLLAKRLRTLAQLRLLEYRENEIGPLRPPGRIVAKVSHRLRQLLRLDLVG